MAQTTAGFAQKVGFVGKQNIPPGQMGPQHGCMAVQVDDPCADLWHLRQRQRMVDQGLACDLHQRLAARLETGGFDLLSIDLDGNDPHVLAALLANGVRPSVLVVEYNGKFPPPIRFQMDYDPEHRFAENDYYGASLQVFADMLVAAGYRLVACNVTGLNAFFVHDRFADRLPPPGP